MLPLERVVLISGLTCAGKTAAGHFLAGAMGYTHYEASDVMQKLIAGAADEQKTLDELALDRLTERPLEVPRTILEQAKHEQNSRIVITGLRSPAEVSFLLRFSPKVLMILAPEDVRYKRSLTRRRSDRAQSLEAFRQRDSIQREMGVERIATVCDVLSLSNTGTLKDYERDLMAAIK